MEPTEPEKNLVDRLGTCKYVSPCVACRSATRTQIATINGGEVHVCDEKCLQKAFELGELIEELLA